MATSISGVCLEGLEVVFIVIALGGLNSMLGRSPAPASAWSRRSAGVVLRHPLTRVPENLMTYVVDVMADLVWRLFRWRGSRHRVVGG